MSKQDRRFSISFLVLLPGTVTDLADDFDAQLRIVLKVRIRLCNCRCERFEYPVQFRVADIAQILTELDRSGPERARQNGAFFLIFPRVYRTLSESNMTDRAIAEKAIDPFDNVRSDMLHHRHKGTGNQQVERAALFLAARKADRFGQGYCSITFADNFRPAADHRTLDEAVAPKGGAADFRYQIGDALRRTAAWALVLLIFFDSRLYWRFFGHKFTGSGVFCLFITGYAYFLRHYVHLWHGIAMAVDSFPAKARKISTNIGAHYVDNARILPWRTPPGGDLPDPYHVWLSEVMLQQTTVGAVKDYFEKFTRRWPTVRDLAGAEEADVLAAWAGLGYYARARNLYKCAVHVTENLGAIFPQKESELLKLPGVGAYTAAAISAIAFGERTVVVDANIERLVARLFAIDRPLPGGKAEIRAAMDAITPESGAGDFAQACMDIGATICTSKNPKCDICPVQQQCAAFVIGNMEYYPVKPPKKAKPVRRARFFWIEHRDQLLLSTRPPKGMLGGMRGLPDDGWAAGNDGHGTPPFSGKWLVHDNIIQHSFTHFALEVDLAVYQDGKMLTNKDDNIWWPLDNIVEAGLPTLYAKAVDWKLKEEK